MLNASLDAMNRMVNALIDSDDEDMEPHAQVLLGKPLCPFICVDIITKL